MKEKTIVIIGGGPGGYRAAIYLADSRYRIVLIEESLLGGVCLNEGCISTKALLYHGEQFRRNKTDSAKLAWIRAQKNQQDIIIDEQDYILGTLQELGVEVIKGRAQFCNKDEIEVGSFEEKVKIVFDYCIIATGSVPKIWNKSYTQFSKLVYSRELLKIKDIPNRLLIIGGGMIGIEIAEIFEAFGTEVTILEKGLTILSNFDADIVQLYKRSLAGKKIIIYTEVDVEEIEEDEEGINCIFKINGKYEEIEADLILYAGGRCANIKNMKIDSAGIDYCEQGIIVNKEYKTTNPKVFAIGDCNNSVLPKVAYLAENQAYQVARIINQKSYKCSNAVLECCYAKPQIFQVVHFLAGKDNVIERKCVFKGNPVAKIQNDKYTLLKIGVERNSHKIVKIAMVGNEVINYSGEAVVIVENTLTLEELAFSSHPHPTICEEIQKLAISILNEIDA